MYYGHNPKFPDNFMWGASSAAWQVEGGVADGGRTPAIIDLNSKTKKPFADNTYAAALAAGPNWASWPGELNTMWSAYCKSWANSSAR